MSEKFEVIKKESLFLENNIQEKCDKWDIESFTGVILAKEEYSEEYIVFASTCAEMIKKYEASDHILPKKSANIFEKFNNEKDAVLLYNFIAGIFAQIPKFVISEKMQNCKGFHVYHKRDNQETNLKHENILNKKIYEFMKGVCVYCNISSYKDRFNRYVITINEKVRFVFEEKEDFLLYLEEIKNYSNSLFKITLKKPDWFKLSHKTFLDLIYKLSLFYDNDYCNKMKIDTKSGEFFLDLKKDEYIFEAMITTPTRNAAYWGEDIYCQFIISENLLDKLDMRTSYNKFFDNPPKNEKYVHYKRINDINLDLILKILNEIF